MHNYLSDSSVINSFSLLIIFYQSVPSKIYRAKWYKLKKKKKKKKKMKVLYYISMQYLNLSLQYHAPKVESLIMHGI